MGKCFLKSFFGKSDRGFPEISNENEEKTKENHTKMTTEVHIFGHFSAILYPKNENDGKVLFEFSFRKLGHGFPTNFE